MRRRSLLAALCAGALARRPARAQPAQAAENGAARFGTVVPRDDRVRPVGESGAFVNLLNATFGRDRPDATVRNKRDLDGIAYYRYIYGDATTVGDGTDGLYKNYRSRHRDYPEGDPRSLHVFTADRLVLKAHCGLESAKRNDCGDGNIESGILRFALQIRPGDFVEIRCRMPKGRYAWPAFWLNPGSETPTASGKPTISALEWPPEIDIFDEFGFNGVDPGYYLISGTPTNGHDADYGPPRDIYRAPDWGKEWYYTPAADLAAAEHVYGLDWGTDQTLRYLLDGRVYRETHYVWNSKHGLPAHLIASLQIGPKFNDLGGIVDQGGVADGWDWPIDYIRVWRRGA
jgi:hypothetical protein